MKVLLHLIVLFTLIFPVSVIAKNRTKTEHLVYLKGTSYELHVYKIYGREPGKTMLIIGGIQGDEPGGFLSADLYTELTLEKGNLIVVPRANFKSIILFKRGVDGDMNRIFDKENGNSMMDKVVTIIKGLMKEADVFLNLHDGYGFYRPVYINELYNPYRFGQSIIIDTDVYTCENGRELRLKEIAEQVIKNVNKKIKEEKYHMHLLNTKTDAPDTPFPEMKKTATYYALKYHCLLAFGVETSKNLPDIELKILHHNYVINEFMKIFGIVPEQPRVLLIKPVLKYVVLNINGRPLIVTNGETVFLEAESEIMVTHIESNCERGLSCDILGIGDVNDYRKPLRISHSTKIIFRKDNIKIGSVDIKIRKNNKARYWVFIVRVNKQLKAILSEEILNLKDGDEIEILKVFGDSASNIDYPINFKGFVPPGITVNTGDDRGIKITINSKKLVKKFSKNGKGILYPVVVEGLGKEAPRFWIRLSKS
jgi:hypothetical protein